MLRTTLLTFVVAVGLVACSRDNSAIRLQIGESLRSALDSFPTAAKVSAELAVTCDNGSGGTVKQAVDVGGGFIDLENVPACGPARLTLKLLVDVGDGGPPITTFVGDATATLQPRVIIDVVFSGSLYGEIVLDPTLPTGGTCTLDNGKDPPITVAVGADPVSVAAPVGSYGILCTSASAPDFITTGVVGAGARDSVSVALVPLAINVQLASITVNGVPIGDFSAQKTNYRVVLPYDTTSLALVATSVQADSVITIGGVQPAAATVTFDAPLVVGPLVVRIIVTSADGTASATYTVTVIRVGPTISSISFFNDSAIEPLFSVASTGPYAVYYPVDQGTAELTLSCDPDCTFATVTSGGNPVTGDGDFFGFGINFGETEVDVGTVGPDGNPVTYTFFLVRGGIINIVCDVGTLSPTFDPQTSSYDDIVTAAVTSATCTATATPHVNAPPLVLDTVGSSFVMQATTALLGAPLEQYTITLTTGVTGTNILYDQFGDNNQFVSSFVDATSGRPAVPQHTEDGVDPWFFSAQRPGTNNVYLLYGGAGSDMIVRTVSVDGTMPMRAVTTPAKTLADYKTNIGGGGMGLSTMTFHPSLPIIYGWSIDGFAYALDITKAFNDAPAGSGLPNGVATTLGSTAASATTADLGVTSDHGWLVAALHGPLTSIPNVIAYSLNPVSGAYTATMQQIVTGMDIELGAFSRDGSVLFWADGASMNATSFDFAGQTFSPGTSIPATGVKKIIAHPTSDFVCAAINATFGCFTYTTGLSPQISSIDSAAIPGATITDMGMNLAGDLLWVRYIASDSFPYVGFATIAGNGSVTLGAQQQVDTSENSFALASP